MTTSVARNFRLGVELTEIGLGFISDQIHRKRPDLFETSKSIEINKDSKRVLKFYGFIPEPIAFNFFPIENSDLEKDCMFVEAKMGFTLTDVLQDENGNNIGLGEFLKVDLAINASMFLDAESSVDGQMIKIYLRDARFIDFDADTVQRALSSAGATDEAFESPEFVVLLNYVIEVFLRDALEKPIAEFPFPALQLMPEARISLHMRGLQIDGDTLGVYLHDVPGKIIPIQGGVPGRNSHLSIGVVEPLIRRMINAYLPITEPIEEQSTNRFLYIRNGSWIRINKRSEVDLRPPSAINAKLFFEMDLKLGIYVKLGKYSVREHLTLPFRSPSHIRTDIKPFIVEDLDRFVIKGRLRPNLNDPAYLLAHVDYRRKIKEKVEKWLSDNVTPILRKIPFIGWIISKGIRVIVLELMDIFIGRPLTVIASALISVVGTFALNIIAFAFSDKLEFDLYEVDKQLPINKIPLEISRMHLPPMINNQGGELIAEAYFEGEPGEYPEIPVPEYDDPVYQDLPTEPIEQIQYPPEAFQPAMELGLPNWKAGTSLKYKIAVGIAGVYQQKIVQTVEFNELTGPDRILAKLELLVDGVSQIQRRLELNNQTGVIDVESEIERLQDDDTNILVKSKTDYDVAGGSAKVTVKMELEQNNIGRDLTTEQEHDVVLPQGASVISTSSWFLMLMRDWADHDGDEAKKVGRLDIRTGDDADNTDDWARLIPTQVNVTGTEILNVGGVDRECFIVELVDCGEEPDRMTSTKSWVEMDGLNRVVKFEQLMDDYIIEALLVT